MVTTKTKQSTRLVDLSPKVVKAIKAHKTFALPTTHLPGGFARRGSGERDAGAWTTRTEESLFASLATTL